jgi:hypothetical protein
MARMCLEAGSYDQEAIRAQFLERFSRRAVVERLDRVYRKVLEGGGPSWPPSSQS